VRDNDVDADADGDDDDGEGDNDDGATDDADAEAEIEDADAASGAAVGSGTSVTENSVDDATADISSLSASLSSLTLIAMSCREAAVSTHFMSPRFVSRRVEFTRFESRCFFMSARFVVSCSSVKGASSSSSLLRIMIISAAPLPRSDARCFCCAGVDVDVVLLRTVERFLLSFLVFEDFFVFVDFFNFDFVAFSVLLVVSEGAARRGVKQTAQTR
jgi:hypothetical protein